MNNAYDGKMTKDGLIFGGLAGIVGNVLKEVLTWVSYGVGAINYTFTHMCSGLVVSSEYVKTPLGLTLGVLVDFTVAAVFGVAIHMILEKTGTRHIVLKGLLFGILIYLFCYSIMRPNFSSIKGYIDPVSVSLYISANGVYGITTSWFIKKYDAFIRN